MDGILQPPIFESFMLEKYKEYHCKLRDLKEKDYQLIRLC